MLNAKRMVKCTQNCQRTEISNFCEKMASETKRKAHQSQASSQNFQSTLSKTCLAILKQCHAISGAFRHCKLLFGYTAYSLHMVEEAL